MTNRRIESFSAQTSTYSLHATLSEWDTEAFETNSATVERFEIHSPTEFEDSDLVSFMEWLNHNSINIVSARLPQGSLIEGFALEKFGFRFIEMTLHPYKKNLQTWRPTDKSLLQIRRATHSDVEYLEREAHSAFTFERFHADPRIDSFFASNRYANWLKSSFNEPTREILIISKLDGVDIGFFVTHTSEPPSSHWMLTALFESQQGLGLGGLAWESVLDYQKRAGIEKITTTISARNTAVLNLYSKLSFNFSNPEMTYHYIAG